MNAKKALALTKAALSSQEKQAAQWAKKAEQQEAEYEQLKLDEEFKTNYDHIMKNIEDSARQGLRMIKPGLWQKQQERLFESLKKDGFTVRLGRPNIGHYNMVVINHYEITW